MPIGQKMSLLQPAVERHCGAGYHRRFTQKPQGGVAIGAIRDVLEQAFGKMLGGVVDRLVVRELFGGRVVVGKDVLGVEIGVGHASPLHTLRAEEVRV